ncbi:type II secretion system protein GspM [Jannaschia aquimarina]|uniref:General secretion pathway protein M n=1 Tax=Jannaschia aquimarina TaxID=935700 RepID=A0A0D1EG52_9RHOB|nr:type II secretion system protein GspM [Jannaschia aquimarina]KIT15871.1 General secretion pathway protein M [Jannaschia aquimarina]SNT10463.1 Type II secretion system (T2SS), protein M subtype b [Jannaschia aquimarina]
MSDFHFSRPKLPRQVLTVLFAGFVLFGVGATGLTLSVANGKADAIADMRHTIARAEARTAPAQPSGETSEHFYKGTTPQLAQAALQTDLQTLAEAHDIAVEVMRADEIEQMDGMVRLNLTMTAVVPEAELGGFLQSVSGREPILVVEDLSLRRARASRSGSDRRVAMTMKLYGLLPR